MLLDCARMLVAPLLLGALEGPGSAGSALWGTAPSPVCFMASLKALPCLGSRSPSELGETARKQDALVYFNFLFF